MLSRSIIFTNPENKRLLWFTLVAAGIQFTWFKIDSPYPNFIPDSYSYLQAAYFNDFIHIRPIGYSKFLRLFSSFTRSHLGLVLCQYLFLQAAIVYFFITIRYLFRPGKWMLRILLAITVLNPLFLKLANFITSDALFTALSLTWFTQLLWLQYRPGTKLLLVHALVIVAAFTVRYNALWYPLISVLAIVLAPGRRVPRISILQKLAFIALITALPGSFIVFTRSAYRQQTDTTQFSAFSGWQLAINGLYAYAHEPLDPIGNYPPELRPLHALVNRHMDSLNHVRVRPDATPGIYYLSDGQSPLNRYMYGDTVHFFHRDATRRWLHMGPLYSRYGSWLIKRHPGAYRRYFLLPNLFNYCLPSAEFMGRYGLGSQVLDPVAVYWFQLDSRIAYTYQADFRISFLECIPVLFALANLVFILGVLAFLITGGMAHAGATIKKTGWLVISVWLANLAFSITASVIVLRYQVFALVLLYTFGALLVSHTWRLSLLRGERPADSIMQTSIS